ncbi:MAG: dihydroorotase, partial [Pseudomonadota bacterium]
MTTLTIPRPDDWHLHLRDGAMLNAVAPETARQFARAIAMPNLVPAVLTGADAAAYKARIQTAAPGFEPLMTLYLTEETDIEDMTAAHASGLVTAMKLYPAGATTNSASGVTDFDKIIPILERMSEIGMPLALHGEVSDPAIDIFDREAVFIERVLEPMRRRHPDLRIIMEHLTTCEAVNYVRSAGPNLAGTITAHHLIINRDFILAGGLNPHYFCYPVAKRERHRRAVRYAAVSGDPTIFLGTDSAPHTLTGKMAGAAGIFTATKAMALYAHVFEEEGALDKLENFASRNGPAFYRLPVNEETVTLEKTADPVDYPEKIETPDGPVTVF